MAGGARRWTSRTCERLLGFPSRVVPLKPQLHRASAKRALPELTKPARTATEPAFVPRKTATKKNGKYVDRAEMRRQGLENEFQPVEKLLEDFERRAEENGEDPAQVCVLPARTGVY